jgi:hypothetical protein
MRSAGLRSVLLGLVVLALLFPMIQDITHVLKPHPLKGASAPAPYKKFTWQSWWDASYQDTIGDYIKQNTGVRTNLIRLIDQIDFSILGYIHANGLVVGKKEYLFEDWYIKCYRGEISTPYHNCAERLYKLRKVQDTLSKLGIAVVTIEAGSKVSYYPEYFPENERCDGKPANDHQLFNHLSDSLGIHYIDFNNWFVSLKGKTQGHLFTKQGVHWSIYGAVMAADSFVKYVQSAEKINLPDLKWSPGVPYRKPQKTDMDIYDALNLIVPPISDTFYYPTIWYDGKEREKPKMIFVADSYMWSWVNENIPDSISENWEFWYYNTTVHKHTNTHQCKMENYDWCDSLLQSKVLVFMVSESNISGFGWGFIEKAYDHFYSNKVS